jgi:hypothetical protein
VGTVGTVSMSLGSHVFSSPIDTVSAGIGYWEFEAGNVSQNGVILPTYPNWSAIISGALHQPVSSSVLPLTTFYYGDFLHYSLFLQLRLTEWPKE